LWQGLKKNCRAHVRQAENRGVEIVEAEGPEIIEEYWRLEQEIFARQGVPVPNHRAFYYALWETFHSAGQLNIFAARHAGRVIGVQINAWYADTLYGLYGATDSAYRKSYVGNLLEWRLIAWAAQRGMARYDMIGGTDAGMAEFKQSFGAVPVETPALSSERWRSIALTRRLYGLLRQTVTRARRTPATSPGAATEDTSQI
jgi:CelD/BcsL family acetyltransferase involved in cellulose biosynthesis